MERGTGIVDRHTTAQASTAVQSNGADALFVKVLVNFEQISFVIHPGVQGLAQGGQLAALDDHNRAVDLGDYTDRNGFMFCKRRIGQRDNSC